MVSQLFCRVMPKGKEKTSKSLDEEQLAKKVIFIERT